MGDEPYPMCRRRRASGSSESRGRLGPTAKIMGVSEAVVCRRQLWQVPLATRLKSLVMVEEESRVILVLGDQTGSVLPLNDGLEFERGWSRRTGSLYVLNRGLTVTPVGCVRRSSIFLNNQGHTLVIGRSVHDQHEGICHGRAEPDGHILI